MKEKSIVSVERLPVVEGQLHKLDRVQRFKTIKAVSRETFRNLAERDLDIILGQAQFNERLRIRRIKKTSPSYWFNYSRHKRDRKLWGQVYRSLIKRSDEADRKALLEKVVEHYASEIAGHFTPRVYDFATRAVPYGFNWLLNAASLNRVLPWKTLDGLKNVLTITGEVEHLQKLAKQGTILLVPTHQSNIDSVLIGYVIYLMRLPPFAYGAGLNLFTNPILNFFMSNLGAYTVDRQKNNEIYKQVLKNYSTRILRDGVHSIFFPGGGRMRSGAVESHLKLGLLGTGLDAQIENIQSNRPNPNVYVVPMVMSYHFVLEASSLVEDYLSKLGGARFLGADVDESPQILRILKFFWKFFASKSEIGVRIGKPLDIFGNFVDEAGRSIGPNGTVIDPKRWLMTEGEVRREPQRDQEYVRQLGQTLVRQYYRENTVLTSHLVAFSYFAALRKRYPDLDLFRFLRLSVSQRSIRFEDLLEMASYYQDRVRDLANKGELHLSPILKNSDVRTWVEDGIRLLGPFHDASVLKVNNGVVTTDDMNLVYYYRNRLSGYGLAYRTGEGRPQDLRGVENEFGFLE